MKPEERPDTSWYRLVEARKLGKSSKTLDRLDALYQLISAQEKIIAAAEVEISNIRAVISDVEKECPCRWDDGTGSWRHDGFMYSECQICGANDL